MRRVAAMMSLCVACGRIGFATRGAGGDGGSPAGDGQVVPPDRVVLAVVADTTRTPIANASVLVDRGTTVDRLATDANGAVTIATTTPVDLAVAFQTAGGWRVYSVLAVPPGTAVGLGGRAPDTLMSSKMTVAAPSTSATMYGLTVPGTCGTGLINYAAPMMTVDYAPSCEGKSYHLWTFATPSAGNLDAIDAGIVTLAQNTTQTVQGTWSPLAATSVQITNVPASAGSVGAVFAIVDANGFMATSEFPSVTPAGSTVNLTLHSPSATELSVDIPSTAGVPYGGDSLFVLPATPVPSISVDASMMLPHVTQMSLPPSANMATWTLGTGSGIATATAFEATVTTPATIEWTVLAPGGVTSAAFPALPADLAAADPTGGTWQTAVASELGLGKSYAASLADLDATWLLVGDSPSLPPAATASSDILYTSALGPP